MAIPLPNPNINDFDTNDVQTWSSNKLKDGLAYAGVEIGSEGELIPATAKKVADIEVEEASSTVIFNDLNCKKIMVVVDVTFDETGSYIFTLQAKTDKSPDSFVNTAAYATRSYTANTRYITRLYADCSSGIMQGYAVATVPNSYGNPSMSNFTNYLDNIDSSIFKTVQVYCSVNIPVGTKITVYAV